MILRRGRTVTFGIRFLLLLVGGREAVVIQLQEVLGHEHLLALVADFPPGDEAVVDAFAAQIAAPTTTVLSSVAAFVIIFCAVLFVLSLLTGLLDLIFTLPVLRSANLLLGFLLGAAEAAFIACLLASVMSVLAGSLGAVDPSLFGTDVVEDTIICKFVMEHNILDRMTAALGWNG